MSRMALAFAKEYKEPEPASSSSGVQFDVAPEVAVPDAIEPDAVISLVNRTSLQHVVQRKGLQFDAELLTSQLMIRDPYSFLNNPVEMILGRNLDSANLNTLNAVFSASEKKTRMLQDLEDFVTSMPGSRAIRESSLVMADELYTNGARISGGRKDGRTGSVEFTACSDGSRLVICVTDEFGELNVNDIIKRIHNCFQNGVAESINNGAGGAGIGSFMVFNNCSAYYAAVEKGRRSVVCVALPLGLNRRETSEMPKNIHLLTVK